MQKFYQLLFLIKAAHLKIFICLSMHGMYRYLYMHICICVGVCVNVWVYIFFAWLPAKVQSCYWVSFLNYSPLYLLKQFLPQNLELASLSQGSPFLLWELGLQQPLLPMNLSCRSWGPKFLSSSLQGNHFTHWAISPPRAAHFKTTHWTVHLATASYFLTVPLLWEGLTCKAKFSKEFHNTGLNISESCTWDPCQWGII